MLGPGILLFVLVTIYIGVRAWLQPSLAPALPVEERGRLGAEVQFAEGRVPAAADRVPDARRDLRLRDADSTGIVDGAYRRSAPMKVWEVARFRMKRVLILVAFPVIAL